MLREHRDPRAPGEEQFEISAFFSLQERRPRRTFYDLEFAPDQHHGIFLTPATAGQGSDLLSGSLFAASLGRGFVVEPRSVFHWPSLRSDGARDQAGTSDASSLSR